MSFPNTNKQAIHLTVSNPFTMDRSLLTQKQVIAFLDLYIKGPAIRFCILSNCDDSDLFLNINPQYLQYKPLIDGPYRMWYCYSFLQHLSKNCSAFRSVAFYNLLFYGHTVYTERHMLWKLQVQTNKWKSLMNWFAQLLGSWITGECFIFPTVDYSAVNQRDIIMYCIYAFIVRSLKYYYSN